MIIIIIIIIITITIIIIISSSGFSACRLAASVFVAGGDYILHVMLCHITLYGSSYMVLYNDMCVMYICMCVYIYIYIYLIITIIIHT